MEKLEEDTQLWKLTKDDKFSIGSLYEDLDVQVYWLAPSNWEIEAPPRVSSFV